MTGQYRRWLYTLVVLLTLIAALYLLGWGYALLQTCSNILALYFTAWLLQFFFTPVVDLMTRYRIPRAVAVAYVYLVLLLVFVIAIVAIAEPAVEQAQHLAGQIGSKQTYAFITNTSKGIERFLVQHGVPEKDIRLFTEQYSVNLQKGAIHAGSELQKIIQSRLNLANINASTSTAIAFFTTLNTLLINIILVLILAFYMMLDGHTLVRRALAYFPPSVSEVMEEVHLIVNRKFGGYLRGQVILAASYGVLTFAIATGFNLQYSLFIALFAAVMMLIPFIGTVIAILPPIVFYVFNNVSHFSVLGFIVLLVLLIGSQQLVINVLAPRVMSTAVGMHPLLVVLGLLLGTKIAGLWGAIFGVPVFGVLMETADLIYRRVVERRYGFYPPKTGPEDDLEEQHAARQRAPVSSRR